MGSRSAPTGTLSPGRLAPRTQASELLSASIQSESLGVSPMPPRERSEAFRPLASTFAWISTREGFDVASIVLARAASASEPRAITRKRSASMSDSYCKTLSLGMPIL